MKVQLVLKDNKRHDLWELWKNFGISHKGCRKCKMIFCCNCYFYQGSVEFHWKLLENNESTKWKKKASMTVSSTLNMATLF